MICSWWQQDRKCDMRPPDSRVFFSEMQWDTPFLACSINIELPSVTNAFVTPSVSSIALWMDGIYEIHLLFGLGRTMSIADDTYTHEHTNSDSPTP